MNYNFTCYNLSGSRPNMYAIVVFLPPELDELVSSLRERFDPEYNVVDSHLTIVFPFESSLSLDKISGIIKEETTKIEPLEITLESIGDFYPNVPLIYWQVANNPLLGKLYKNLYARFELALPHRKYVPHVTVAREISYHRVMLVKDKIVSYLPREQFYARAIDLVSPVADHRWLSVRTFPIPQP